MSNDDYIMVNHDELYCDDYMDYMMNVMVRLNKGWYRLYTMLDDG